MLTNDLGKIYKPGGLAVYDILRFSQPSDDPYSTSGDNDFDYEVIAKPETGHLLANHLFGTVGSFKIDSEQLRGRVSILSGEYKDSLLQASTKLSTWRTQNFEENVLICEPIDYASGLAERNDWFVDHLSCAKHPVQMHSVDILFDTCQIQRGILAAFNVTGEQYAGELTHPEHTEDYDSLLGRYHDLVDKDMMGRLGDTEKSELSKIEAKLNDLDTEKFQNSGIGSIVKDNIKILESIIAMNKSLVEMVRNAKVREASESESL